LLSHFALCADVSAVLQAPVRAAAVRRAHQRRPRSLRQVPQPGQRRAAGTTQRRNRLVSRHPDAVSSSATTGRAGVYEAAADAA
jgi:hypothetical protein